MSTLAVYTGLFFVSFLAATFFPAQSEFALAALLTAGDYSIALLVLVASIGNTLGSLVNWILGRGIEQFRERRWFPVPPDKLEQASRWYRRYGKWSLLLSWMPIIGDPITLVAGVLKEPLPSFLILVFIAKFMRYVGVTALTLNLF